MGLDEAQEIYEEEPCLQTLKDYIQVLYQYNKDGMIDDDTFFKQVFDACQNEM